MPYRDFLEHTYVILLVKGKSHAGETYAYVSVRSDKLVAFQHAMQHPPFHLHDYAVILEHGTGEPPADVKEKMHRDFGFDHEKMVVISKEES